MSGRLVSDFNNAAGGAALKGNQLFGPYGTGRYYAGNINTAKGFTGQYNDGSGLDYYNARYYDPVVGVFLSADIVQGNLQGMNPYAYVNGNPETESDPSGRYIVGPGGQTYYPGSPYYTQGGVAYAVSVPGDPTKQFKDGTPYNGNGFVNGRLSTKGPNAQRQSGPKIQLANSPNSGCDAACQAAEQQAQNYAKAAAAHFQSIADLFNSITAPWWLNLITVGIASAVVAMLQAIANIAEIYAKGFAAEAKWQLSQFDWVSVDNQNQIMQQEASTLTTREVFTALGIAVASYALVAIGNFISAIGGPTAEAIGSRILKYASGGPIGASVAAAGIWTGSFVLEQQSDDYAGQQEQTLSFTF